MEAAAERAEETPVSGKQTRLQDRGTDGHVAQGAVDGVVKGACGVADLEAKIPQAIENAADGRFLARCDRTGEQEEEIEIRMWRELAASIAADGDQGHAVLTAISPFQDMGEQFLQHRVDKPAHRGDERDPGGAAVEMAAQPRQTIVEHTAQHVFEAFIRGRKGGERPAQVLPVDKAARYGPSPGISHPPPPPDPSAGRPDRVPGAA